MTQASCLEPAESVAVETLGYLDELIARHEKQDNGGHNGVSYLNMPSGKSLCERGFALMRAGRRYAPWYEESLNCFQQVITMKPPVEVAALAYFGQALLYYFQFPEECNYHIISEYFRFVVKNTNDAKVRAQAWYYLGEMHYYAKLGKPDYVRAANFYLLAGNQRDDSDTAFYALVRLAIINVLGGYGVTKNIKLAMHYRNEANKLKNP